jgi:WD40 repeat protein
MKNWNESWRTDEGHVEWTHSFGIPADGAAFVSGGEDGAVKGWDVKSGLIAHDLQWPLMNGKADICERSRVAFSADGRYIAGVASVFGRRENLITLWETDSARLVESIRQPAREPRVDFASSMRHAVFDKKTRYLLTGDGCSNLFYWSLDL